MHNISAGSAGVEVAEGVIDGVGVFDRVTEFDGELDLDVDPVLEIDPVGDDVRDAVTCSLRPIASSM